jgi:nucleoside-diphosphate-sugar epimerase
MKKALVLGGTGLVGKELIELLLQDNHYSITALVRKALPIQNERLTQVIINYDNPKNEVVIAEEVFCCLGTTIKVAGSQKAFYKVDFEYPYDLAKRAYLNGAKKFALVSSLGANKKSSLFYSKTKGEIEEAITKIGYESLFILRPALLLGNRLTPRPGERIAQLFFTKLSFLIPKKYKAIQARQVAKAMITCMNIKKVGVHILESHKIAEL